MKLHTESKRRSSYYTFEHLQVIFQGLPIDACIPVPAATCCESWDWQIIVFFRVIYHGSKLASYHYLYYLPQSKTCSRVFLFLPKLTIQILIATSVEWRTFNFASSVGGGETPPDDPPHITPPHTTTHHYPPPSPPITPVHPSTPTPLPPPPATYHQPPPMTNRIYCRMTHKRTRKIKY